MRRSLFLLSLLLVPVTCSAAQPQSPISMTWAQPGEVVWNAILFTLPRDGWHVDRADPALGLVIASVGVPVAASPSAASPSFVPSARTRQLEAEYDSARNEKPGVFYPPAWQIALKAEQAREAWQQSLEADQAAYDRNRSASPPDSARPVSGTTATALYLNILITRSDTSTTVTASATLPPTAYSGFMICQSNGVLEAKFYEAVDNELSRRSPPPPSSRP